MEFLNNLILPVSINNLNLLSYLFILGKIIFFAYSGVILVSTFYSISKRNNSSEINYNKEFTNLAAFNHLLPYGLSVLPFFAILLICFILMNNIQTEVKSYLFLSFLIYVFGIVLFSIHKQSVNKGSNESTWGNSSLILQFVALVVFSSITSGMEVRDNWFADKTLIQTIFNFNSIIDLLLFILFSISFTNISFIYKMKENKFEDAAEFKSMNKTAIYCLGALLLVFNINFFSVNQIGYSSFSFVFGVAAVASMILQLVLLYIDGEKLNHNKSFWGFSNAILFFALINIANFSFFSYASEKQVNKVAAAYDKIDAEYKLAHSKVEIDGKEIYQAKCMACHKYDQKLVGPPHKDVMIKYAGKQEAMIQFILKPVKVDPAYPDMPQQGLTPAEAKAVVEFMYKEYGEKLNK